MSPFVWSCCTTDNYCYCTFSESGGCTATLHVLTSAQDQRGQNSAEGHLQHVPNQTTSKLTEGHLQHVLMDALYVIMSGLHPRAVDHQVHLAARRRPDN
jgi:hypothetical protein